MAEAIINPFTTTGTGLEKKNFHEKVSTVVFCVYDHSLKY